MLCNDTFYPGCKHRHGINSQALKPLTTYLSLGVFPTEGVYFTAKASTRMCWTFLRAYLHACPLKNVSRPYTKAIFSSSFCEVFPPLAAAAAAVEDSCRARRKEEYLKTAESLKKNRYVGNMCRKGVKLLNCGETPQRVLMDMPSSSFLLLCLVFCDR